MSRGRVRLERDDTDQVVLSAPAEQRPLRSAHKEVRRAGDGPRARRRPTGAGRQLGARNRRRSLLHGLCRPSVARFGAVARCANRRNERVVAGDAASSGLGPSREVSDPLRPYQPFRRCGCFSLCPEGDELEACST
jgi:hypothetical protein